MRTIIVTIPLLATLAVIELVASRARGKRWHGLWDSLGNVGCGLLEQASGMLLYPVIFALYYALEARAAFVLPVDAAWAWVVGFLLSDLAFYLFHRTAHTVNVIWATHIVHHQSGCFNYTVAMRNAAFQRVFAMWFYLPLALLGVPSSMLLVLLSVSLLYQFVLHTRFFGTLGVLGAVLNTPSHHRVHHGMDPEYVDRNFGGILIIWDRLFGTFAAERHEPAYGVHDPALRTSNPIRANLCYWAWLGRLCAARRASWATVWGKAPRHTGVRAGETAAKNQGDGDET